jgi:plasmid stability protein
MRDGVTTGRDGMHSVCYHASRMGVLVQIRDVPAQVHATLKARAALAGMSLSEYLRSVLVRAAARPTPAELSARVEVRGSGELSQPSELTVRRLRDSGE